jgi:demethylphylloquinone reductase
MTEQSTRICILGGGFGGLYTALRLDQLPWDQVTKPEIVLVDQRDHFVFLPLLYELVTGELQSWEIAPPYAELLANTSIRFVQAAVAGVNVDQQQVHLQTGETVPYDRLVLAMGGETPLDLVPGAAEHALPFRAIADAYALEEKLRKLEQSDLDKIRVAVIGAGYSGVELACKLAERLGDRGRLRLVELSDQILRTSPEYNRTTANEALSDRGVWIDLETAVQSISADSLSLLYKGVTDTIPVDLVLWTVGTRIAEGVKNLPLTKNQRGQVIINEMLQVVDRPEIFALGDLADCKDAEGKQIAPTAQVAFQQADYAGWNIWASLSDRPLLPFKYYHLGEMMTLGTNNATLTGLGIQLNGPFAHIARRLAYLYRMPTLEHQLKVGFSWITRPLVAALSGKTAD